MPECPCGFDMPSQVAATMCAAECDAADRETRAIARHHSTMAQARHRNHHADPDDNRAALAGSPKPS